MTWSEFRGGKRSSTVSRVEYPHGVESRKDLVAGCGLGTEVASGSSSGTDALAGSGSVLGGSSHTWSVAGIGSGSKFVAGSNIKLRSTVEDPSCCPGLSGLG